jgi:hypothetical protein
MIVAGSGMAKTVYCCVNLRDSKAHTTRKEIRECVKKRIAKYSRPIFSFNFFGDRGEIQQVTPVGYKPVHKIHHSPSHLESATLATWNAAPHKLE